MGAMSCPRSGYKKTMVPVLGESSHSLSLSLYLSLSLSHSLILGKPAAIS